MKYVYSETINIFRANWKKFALDLLAGQKFPKTNLELVLFDDPGKLGFCRKISRSRYLIGVNKKYLAIPERSLVEELIAHEVAHLIEMELFGATSHGKTFKRICSRLGYGRAAAAKTDIAEDIEKADAKNGGLIQKVEKLLALSESPNENEARLAMAKANQIIQKHNLNYGSQKEEIYMARVADLPRVERSDRAKIRIMEEMGVYAVINRDNQKGSYIELSGSKEKVEVAEYVWDYLGRECERLWQKARKENGWKGKVAKNNYINGVLDGFYFNLKGPELELERRPGEKFQGAGRGSQKPAGAEGSKELAQPRGRSLEQIKRRMFERARDMVYSDCRISVTAQRSSHKGHASRSHGLAQGRKLSVNPGLKNGGDTKLIS